MPRFYSTCAGLNFPIEQPRTAQNDKGQVVTIEPRRIAFTPLHGGVVINGDLRKFGLFETEDPELVAALHRRMATAQDVISEEQYLRDSRPPEVVAKSALDEAERLKREKDALKRENELLMEQLRKQQIQPKPAAWGET